MKSVSRSRLLLLLAYALLFAYGSWNLDFSMELGDEGVALVDGWRVLQGQVPVRDFFEVIPPLSFYPTAIFFKLFGLSHLSARLLTLCYAFLLAFLADRLTARFTTLIWPRLLVVVFLIPFGVFYWPMPSHHWLANCLQIGALLALDTAMAQSGRRLWSWGLLSGALCALAVFSLQDQGGYLVLALLPLFFPWLPPGKRSSLLFAWASGGIAICLGAGALLLPFVSFGQLLDQWLWFPLGHYKAIPDNASSIANTWTYVWKYAFGGWVTEYPIFAAVHALVVGTVVLSPLWPLPMAIRAARKRALDPQMGLLLAGCAAFLAMAARRYCVTNLVWALAMPLVAFAVAFAECWDTGRKPLRLFARGMMAFLLTLLLVYTGYYCFLFRPSATPPLITPAGTLRTGGDAGPTYYMQGLVSAIEKLVPPEEPLFCRGFLPIVNFFSLRTNPTRFTFLLATPYQTEEQAIQWANSLEKGKVKWGYGPVHPPRLQEDPADQYLADHYQVAYSNQLFVLWRRIEDPASR